MLHTKQLVYRAGVIPYIVEDGVIRMMFMIPSNPEFGGSEPQLAKGRVEEGEETKAAALREAREELGLFIGNVSIVEELGQFMGRTTLYVAKIKKRDMFGLPDDETAEVVWMTEGEFMMAGRDLHKPCVQAAVRKIKKLELMA